MSAIFISLTITFAIALAPTGLFLTLIWPQTPARAGYASLWALNRAAACTLMAVDFLKPLICLTIASFLTPEWHVRVGVMLACLILQSVQLKPFRLKEQPLPWLALQMVLAPMAAFVALGIAAVLFAWKKVGLMRLRLALYLILPICALLWHLQEWHFIYALPASLWQLLLLRKNLALGRRIW